jgi:hypothetical protein
MDPNELGQGPGEGGAPAAGSPPAQPDLEAENARLKEENAKLRADRRRERTAALIDQHSLTARQALELAGLGSLEEIEKRAEEFAVENAKAAGQAPPAPAPAPSAEPSSEPSQVDALAAMQGGTDGGQPTPAVDTSWTARMNAEIQKATTLDEVRAIQDKYRAEQMAAANQ